jgi:hypothetical protein
MTFDWTAIGVVGGIVVIIYKSVRALSNLFEKLDNLEKLLKEVKTSMLDNTFNISAVKGRVIVLETKLHIVHQNEAER